MVWQYVAVALVAVAGALLLGRLVRNNSANRLLGAWVCLATTGVWFFLVCALQGEHSPFLLAIGLTCCVVGVVALLGATVKPST
jgi:hypothetical protein